MLEIHNSDGSVRQAEALAPSELADLRLGGLHLVRIGIDYQTRLEFDEIEVVIETPFRLVTQGTEWTLDPNERRELGPLLAIYPACVGAATVRTDLTLRVEFGGGVHLDVPQHPHFEAWQIVGPSSRLIVCPPQGSGTLAVWT